MGDNDDCVNDNIDRVRPPDDDDNDDDDDDDDDGESDDGSDGGIGDANEKRGGDVARGLGRCA